MGKRALFSALAIACFINAFAQDDDMYFVPKKKGAEPRYAQSSEATAKRPARYTAQEDATAYADEEEGVLVGEETAYYSGSMRSVDEYNRRDRFNSDYSRHLQDSLSRYDSVLVSREDYENSMKLKRFDGYNNITLVVNDPWYYDSWAYDPWYYDSWHYNRWRWHSPYYSWHSAWYAPWYYDSWYYSPRWRYGYAGYHYHAGWHGAPHWGHGPVRPAKPVGTAGRGTAVRHMSSAGNRVISSSTNGRAVYRNGNRTNQFGNTPERGTSRNIISTPSNPNTFGGNTRGNSGSYNTGTRSSGGSFNSGGSRSGGGSRGGGATFGGGRR